MGTQPTTVRRSTGASAAALLAASALVGAITLAGPAAADNHPEADLLDVDLADGELIDHARGVEPTLHVSPYVSHDQALERHVVSTEGSQSGVGFSLEDQYEELAGSHTIECVFRYDGELDDEEKSLCANKQAGGFGIAIYGDDLTFISHIGGDYQRASTTAEVGRWYHALGVWDGEEVHLYINGELVDSAPATGAFGEPESGATDLVIGGDSAADNDIQFHSEATFSTTRVFSDALEEADAQALYEASGMPTGDLEPNVILPADGDHLSTATTFAVDWENESTLRDTEYTLNGEDIEAGDFIGPGLEAGTHTLDVDATDVFGREFSTEIELTSANIPGPEGTSTESDGTEALLTATADHPTGDDLNTRFAEGAISVAEGGFTGTVTDLPQTLEFDVENRRDIDDPLQPGDGELVETDSTGDLPIKRFDIPLADGADPSAANLAWSGTVDPARSVHLHAWNLRTEQWEELADGEGVADGQVSLTAQLDEDHVSDGVVHALVLANDRMADELDEPVEDSFEDPADYDFALAHFTDTQYLAREAADEDRTADERAEFVSSYEDLTQWIADNADERKIAYAAHTGDVIDSWTNPDRDEDVARAEFEIASDAQEILDDSGVPNGVLPGNHDNQTGMENGPDNMFNEYFGSDRYEALAESWPEGTSYHPWREGDNDNHYTLFSAGGLDFLALHLAYGVVPEEVEWANEVLEQYPDRNALVFTHAYNRASTAEDGRETAGLSVDGPSIQEGITENHRNVAMVMSGHHGGVSIDIRQDAGTMGNHVVELLADYQFYEVSADEVGLPGDEMLRFGASFLRMLQFDVENSEVSVDTYSPYLDNFGATEYDDHEENRYDGTEDDFRIPVQLESRTTSFASDGFAVVTPTDNVIDEVEVGSGEAAEATWEDLESGTTYAWFATTQDTIQDEPGYIWQYEIFTAGGDDELAMIGSNTSERATDEDRGD